MNKERKSLPLYRQTHPRSCLAASLLMVLHHFEPEKHPLTRENELRIYNKVKFKHEELYGGSYPKAVNFLLDKGYKVKLYLGGIPYDPFPTDIMKYGETLHEFIQHLNKALLKQRFHLVIEPNKYKELDKEIDSLLNQGYKIIAYLHKRWHNVVVFDKEGNYYIVLDPMRGAIKLSGSQLKKEMYSPWFFTFMAVKRDKTV